jgi:hypothetical protein
MPLVKIEQLYYYFCLMVTENSQFDCPQTSNPNCCTVSSSCAKCRRKKCIDDVPRGWQRFRLNKRAHQMLEMRQQGKTHRQIARFFQLNIRTVYRIFASCKEDSSK